MSVVDAIGKAVGNVGKAVGSVLGGGKDDLAAAGDKQVSAAQAAQFASMMSGGGALTGTEMSDAGALGPADILSPATGAAGTAGTGSAQSQSAFQSPLAASTEDAQGTSQSPLSTVSDQTAPQEVARAEVKEQQAVEQKQETRERTEDEVQEKVQRHAEQRREVSERQRDDERVQDRRLVQRDVQAQRAEVSWQLRQQLQSPSRSA